MFCPNCRVEYRPGFTRCSDCLVELVPELPPEETPQYLEQVELLRTYNLADIAIIKSILEAEGITYFFRGEEFIHVRPLVEPAILLVAKEEADLAREILNDLQLGVAGIHLPEEKDDPD